MVDLFKFASNKKILNGVVTLGYNLVCNQTLSIKKSLSFLCPQCLSLPSLLPLSLSLGHGGNGWQWLEIDFGMGHGGFMGLWLGWCVDFGMGFAEEGVSWWWVMDWLCWVVGYGSGWVASCYGFCGWICHGSSWIVLIFILGFVSSCAVVWGR